MQSGRWTPFHASLVLRCLATFCTLTLALAPLHSNAITAAVCDPPGPPPRFGCSWSVDLCDWICAICDPFGAPPRTSCTWDGDLCNWVCPGYTGVDVSVETVQPPAQGATVYVRLSSLCTATGAGAFCNGSFAVHPGTSAAQKCQAIADVVTGNCSAAGYSVTANQCKSAATLTASNTGCPATPFALGLSNDPAVFDQSGQGAMPDGEIDSITGRTPACSPMPGPVGNLQLLAPGGGGLHLTWDDTTDADDYVVFSDTSPNGSFTTVAGTASSGAAGLTLAMPPGTEFYLVAGRNATCGVGPMR
ncbi:MAG TPA: hypothetical protein VFB49_05460 [Patescibacteria group bacterium]|nr:hypothetical protein [Patescibacteria group bacterium]